MPFVFTVNDKWLIIIRVASIRRANHWNAVLANCEGQKSESKRQTKQSPRPVQFKHFNFDWIVLTKMHSLRPFSTELVCILNTQIVLMKWLLSIVDTRRQYLFSGIRHNILLSIISIGFSLRREFRQDGPSHFCVFYMYVLCAGHKTFVASSSSSFFLLKYQIRCACAFMAWRRSIGPFQMRSNQLGAFCHSRMTRRVCECGYSYAKPEWNLDSQSWKQTIPLCYMELFTI